LPFILQFQPTSQNLIELDWGSYFRVIVDVCSISVFFTLPKLIMDFPTEWFIANVEGVQIHDAQPRITHELVLKNDLLIYY
jgi:hypothetical protein